MMQVAKGKGIAGKARSYGMGVVLGKGIAGKARSYGMGVVWGKGIAGKARSYGGGGGLGQRHRGQGPLLRGWVGDKERVILGLCHQRGADGVFPDVCDRGV